MRVKYRITKEPEYSWYIVEYKILDAWTFLRSWHTAQRENDLQKCIDWCLKQLDENKKAEELSEFLP